MDVNQRYKTVDALIQSRIKVNSGGITYLEGMVEYYTTDVKGLTMVIVENNNALKKAAGEIVRLRRTLKNVASKYEDAILSHTKAERSLVEELDDLQKENEELELRLSKLYMSMDKAEGV